MRRRSVAVVLACVMAAALAATGSASAATVVGSSCIGDRGETGIDTLVPITSVSNPNGVAIPSAGVITSWSVNIVTYPGGISEKAEIFRPTGAPNTFSVVGESTMEPIVSGSNTFETRIPVQAGDRLGIGANLEAVYCGEAEGSGEVSPNVFGAYEGTVSLGGSATFTEVPHGQVAVSATLEPDADGDGYGDETQDKCPTNASTQGPCPAPPPPAVAITLSASAAAKKGLVTVTLTSTAQATVTVGGGVKLGKGAGAKLSPSTQIVAPGTLAKFTILFPAKLRTALKQTPASKKLSLSLSASAPGATTTSLKVNLPGQKKATKPRHKKA